MLSEKQASLLKMLRATLTLPATVTLYGAALGAVAALAGAPLPPILASLAGGVGVNALASILERIARGEPVPDDEISQTITQAIQESRIEAQIANREFQQALAQLFQQFDLVRYAVEQSDLAIAEKLAYQFAQYQGMMDALRGDLVIVRAQLDTLATRDQSTAILNQLQTMADRLDAILPPRAPVVAPGTVRLLRIFLASPSDVSDERNRLKHVVDEFNQPGGLAEQYGVQIQLLRWEDAVGGMGIPENVLLEQMPVNAWDIFVGILWTRFGSPTGNLDPQTGLPFDSGTEEEFTHAYRSWKEHGKPHILFYHRTKSPDLLNDINPEQLGRVKKFLQQFMPKGEHPGLFTPYDTPENFERRVRQDLTKLLPRLLPHQQTPPPAEPPRLDHRDLQRAYLEWLERMHAHLELRGIRVQGQLPTIPLEHVFVALKGVRSDPSDVAHSRALLEDEMRAWEQDPRWRMLPELQRREQRWGWLANHPYMPSLIERDRPAVLPERKVEKLNLAEAFRRYRWLVILGDPGSGKTTLARWLVLHLARALLQGQTRLRVPATHVDPTARDSDAPIDLGPARLPVLVRVADFAQARAKRPNLSLIEYLGYHPWLGEKITYGKGHPRAGEPLPPEELNALIRETLRQGKAVIILDGLDELTERQDREQVVKAIETFIGDYIHAPSGLNPFDKIKSWRWQPEQQAPGEYGGNQIIVTSRIAGYHLYPLEGRLPLVTIEPMSMPAIDRFCQTWTLAVNRLTADPADSPAEIEQRARQEAESLQRAIHDPDRPGITEMASNPLLLTILAMLHHNSRARLPEQRVRLYQLAVENLVEVWRETGLTEDAVVNILAPVAAHIHSTSPTGLIPEPELKTLLREPLARYRGWDPQKLPSSFDDELEQFIRTVREQVGLLAARGDYLYGFLHLTFQEYLAARYLTRDPARTLERIQEKLDDPRWREPILLALGFAVMTRGTEEREKLLTDLLEAHDPFADLLPRNALLLAAALPEFEQMPARIVTQVTRRLLTALADRQGIGRFEHLREQIVRALERLRRGNAADAFDRPLEEALRAAPQARDETALAAAWLIQRNGWYTPTLADALLDALPFENQHWDWSVTRALQKIAQTQPMLLPASRLLFRNALEPQTIRDFVSKHEEIQRLLLFLCGGLDAEGKVHPLAVYRQPALARWLEEALKRRLSPQQWVDELKEIWLDASRTPEESAESLLALVGLGEDVWSLLQNPAAQPAAVARARELLARTLTTQGEAADIHVVEAILPEAIKVAAGFPDLVEEALAAARQIQNERYRADALRDLAPHLPPELQAQALTEALAAARQIQDEYDRAAALRDLAPHLPPELLPEALAAARQIQDEYDRAAALRDLAPHLPPELQTQALTEALAAARQIQYEKYRAAALRNLAPHLPPELLPEALAAARQIQDEYWRADALRDLAPHLPPELLPEALAAARQIQYEKYRAAALRNLAPHLPPELLPEALAAARQIQYEPYRAAALRDLAPHLPPELQTQALTEALAAARQIQDERYRAAALRDLAPHLPPELQTQALTEALAAARQIQYEPYRADALRDLAPHLPPELQTQALTEALAAARQIQDERYRAAALRALAPHLPPELLPEALAAARQLPETAFLGSPRAAALRDLVPNLPRELLPEALAAARQLPETAFLGSPRAAALRDLIPELGKHILLWKAFWLQLRQDLLRSRPYRMAESVVQRLSPPFPWELIASAATRSAALEEILRRAYREGNLSLTVEAVQAIQTLLKSGEERNARALLRLTHPEKDVPIPKLWLTHPLPEIRPLAYLLRAEAGTLDTTTLDALVALLRGADDRCRYRASQVLLQQRDTLKLTPSFIEALARLAQETENEPQVGTVLDWTLDRLEHDQSEWLVGWLERMENDQVARRIVTSIRNLNNPCWEALFAFAQRQKENSPLLEPLLEAMGRVAQAEKIPDKDVAALEAWLQAQVARALFPNEALHVIEYLPPAETRIGYLQEVLKSAPEVRRAAGHALARQAAGLTNVQGRVAVWLREQATQASHPEERALWAGAWLRMHVLSASLAPEYFPPHGTLEELATLADNSDEVMLDAVLYAGADTHIWSDYHERLLRVLDRILGEQMLVHFIGRMRQEIAHREWSRRRIMMACAGVVAERLPGQFAQQAGDRQLERDLLAAMNDPMSFSVRRFAFSALSHLPRVSVEVLRALPLAMRDVEKVQQDALQAVVHFRRIEGDLTAALAETLFDPSAAVAYASAQMLEALGRSDKTTAEERRAILLALAQAVRDSRSQREVCVQDGENIRYLGQLDHLLHRALLRIAEGGRG